MIRFKPIRSREHLFFNFLEFRFFGQGETGSLLFFGSTRALHPLVVIPYILIAEIIFFRGWRYFVRLEGHVVGVLAVHEEAEALFVSSLAVVPQRRRLGIATSVLIYAEKLAKRLGKERLELSVLRGNIPAQKLYERCGFVRKQEKRWSIVLSRGVEKQARID